MINILSSIHSDMFSQYTADESTVFSIICISQGPRLIPETMDCTELKYSLNFVYIQIYTAPTYLFLYLG